MLSFMSSLRASSDAFAIFVSEKYEYRDVKGVLSKDVSKKINLFLKSLKVKKQQEEINSLDISDKKRCFIIKIKNKYQNNYFEEIGSSFFTYIKKYQTVNSVDIYADSLSEEKNKLSKIFSEFIFGFDLKSYVFNKYKETQVLQHNLSCHS